MKICEKCSVANDDKAVFCTGCGAVLPNGGEVNTEVQTNAGSDTSSQSYEAPAENSNASQAQQTPYSQANMGYTPPASPYVQPVFSQPAQPQMPYSPQYGYINENMLPPEYRPVTIGQYILYSLLFSIPLVGFIMLLVTAFGSDKSISLRNYAKSFLIMYAAGVALSFVIFFFFGILMASIGASPY